MKTSEPIQLLADQAFLNKLYGWAYHRCYTSHEAEDLCADIVLAIVKAVRKTEEVTQFYALAWTIARRTYADYCKRRQADARHLTAWEAAENRPFAGADPIDTLVEQAADKAGLQAILREIGFLSRIYREVMVLYYLEEMPVAVIAEGLGISQNAVKQRLFSARQTVKKEVEKMDTRNLSLQPIQLAYIGTGNPMNNDPSEKAERTLSQNLIYLCKNEAKSAKELAEALCVPMPYIEEELDIQCRGENGTYGTLRRLENGKYIANILVVDTAEATAARAIYARQLPALCDSLRGELAALREELLAIPFLSRQDDAAFILWPLLARAAWSFSDLVSERLTKTYFSEVEQPRRPFSCVAIAGTCGDEGSDTFYGCDGVNSRDVGGFSQVFVENMYGPRLEKHFACELNISTDAPLLLTLRAIGGLPVDSLSKGEQETAAKAIECGYLRRVGEQLEPRILVLEEKEQDRYFALVGRLTAGLHAAADAVASELAAFIQAHIPPHLLGEYHFYNKLIATTGVEHGLIEMAISEGLLTEPNSRLNPEGVLMIVEK